MSNKKSRHQTATTSPEHPHYNIFEDILSRLERVAGPDASGNFKALCPFHDDRGTPNLSVHPAKGFNCFACHEMGSIKKLAQKLGITTPRAERTLRPGGLTMAELTAAKRLPEDELRNWGVRDQTRQGNASVKIPYFAADGSELAMRTRHALAGDLRFTWRKGDKVAPYGLWQLRLAKQLGWILLVEGESDAWTAWHHTIPALGIPGKSTWRSEWKRYLGGLTVYLWEEPGAEGFTKAVAADIPGLMAIKAPEGIKDISEAHIRGEDVPTFLERLKDAAVPAAQIYLAETAERRHDLKRQASAVLGSPDPLDLVRNAITGSGYGGDMAPPLIVYLCMTTRLLPQRRGSMPAHLILLGPPSAGKTFALGTALRLLPQDAYISIEAGSPRVLIYDSTPIQHKVVIFGEAGSIPTGEDNPAASALRSLLQDGNLTYKVAVRDAETGDFTVRQIDREGPAVLITSSVRRLGEQLQSRLFELEVPDSDAQVAASLKAQALVEMHGVAAADESLIAYQGYLQTLAPIDIVVPFVDVLADMIAQNIPSPRINRDFARLLSLVKAVTILRHKSRRQDAAGRFIAELEDYAAVYELVGDMFAASADGASLAVRATVAATVALLDAKPSIGDVPATITVGEIAARLGVNKSSASRTVKRACRSQWLLNDEGRNGHPARVRIGDPLPARAGLPLPKAVGDRCTVAPLQA